jgi:lipid II:glycine glycyltransferase (peptidoglycan interpeptide bridge formation enzyme)
MRPEVWDAWVAGHPYGTILQTSGWGQHKAAFGWDWEIVAAEPEAAGALVLYRPLPLRMGRVAYVPRGPVVAPDDAADVARVLDAVEAAARQRHAWALWIEPAWFDGPAVRATLRAAGFAPLVRAIQPPRTLLVDLAPDEEAILAAMKSKTRYNIRLAGRKGVTVRASDDVATFYRLMTTTGERNEFGVHSAAYYRHALTRFEPQSQATLLLAEVEGDTVAGLMAFALGRMAWYFYGASSNRHREKMPTYALQWAAMQWARAQGCTCYDLWGIPDADVATLEAEFTERSDGLWGVYRFKRGFGGEVVRYAGLWEKSLHPLWPAAKRARETFARWRGGEGGDAVA